MEKLEDKNYTKILENGEEEKKTESKITIHTMPKRYLPSSPTKTSAKSTGLLILILGALFLVLALMLFYFYILKRDPLVNISQEPDNGNQVLVDPQVEPGKPSQPDPATSTPVVVEPTSSSTPIKIVNGSTLGDKKYLQATDSDRDGLSDLEELILASSPNSDDTDGDGYLDKQEVINLYDPASKSRLIDSVYVEEYTVHDYEFTMYIASVWTVDSISGEESLIIPLSKGQFIQLNSQNNTQNQTIEEWYKEIIGVEEIKDEQIYKKGNWNGIINDTKLTYYLEHPNKKYFITVHYEIGDDNTLYYKNIFDMMLQSMSIK